MVTMMVVIVRWQQQIYASDMQLNTSQIILVLIITCWNRLFIYYYSHFTDRGAEKGYLERWRDFPHGWSDDSKKRKVTCVVSETLEPWLYHLPYLELWLLVPWVCWRKQLIGSLETGFLVALRQTHTKISANWCDLLCWLVSWTFFSICNFSLWGSTLPLVVNERLCSV